MDFQAEKGTDRQANVIPLSLSGAVLCPLHTAERLQAPVILFYMPGLQGIFRTFFQCHLQVTGCPVFHVAVWGHSREYLDESISLQMNNRSVTRNQHLANRPVTGSVQIDQLVGFERGQLMPTLRADYLPSDCPNWRTSCQRLPVGGGTLAPPLPISWPENGRSCSTRRGVCRKDRNRRENERFRRSTPG